MHLPALVFGEDDLRCVRYPPARPNFVGHGRIEAAVLRVHATTRPEDVPPGRVLAIESADPGYDWIFARAPAALVTAFGGPYSHMALRCAECAVPAALGIGLEAFRRLGDGERLRIDLDAGIIGH